MIDINKLREDFNLFLFDTLNYGIEELIFSNKIFKYIEVVLNEA